MQERSCARLERDLDVIQEDDGGLALMLRIGGGLRLGYLIALLLDVRRVGHLALDAQALLIGGGASDDLLLEGLL